ncbi:hypothetical protein GCM10022255_085690 [Dactylosporangium darangshiense]|uniref:Transposase n=1 Tax=Dactylosporangium darangshiense TaxID=579108 RepID=A0ABP8DMR8_9ACTN
MPGGNCAHHGQSRRGHNASRHVIPDSLRSKHLTTMGGSRSAAPLTARTAEAMIHRLLRSRVWVGPPVDAACP